MIKNSQKHTKNSRVVRYRVVKISLKSILVEDGRRQLNERHVKKLATDIETDGLHTPVTICKNASGRIVLVTGYHRVAACKKLKWKKIPAFIVDEDDAEGWSITENLLRLNDSYLDTCIAFARLAEIRVGTHVRKGGKQPHDKGINKISQELSVSRRTVSRRLKIASLDCSVIDLIKERGLAGKRSLLGSLSDLPDRSHQIQAIMRYGGPSKTHAPTSRRKAEKGMGNAPKAELPKHGSETLELIKGWRKSGLAKLYDQQRCETKVAFVRAMFSRKVIERAVSTTVKLD